MSTAVCFPSSPAGFLLLLFIEMRSSVRRNKRPKRDKVAKIHSRRSNGVSTALVCVLLVAAVWIVFGQTLGYDFVNYDDHEYVYENPRITRGLSFDGMLWAFSHVHSSNWHPITTMSHMLDCSIYGLQPWGHHFTNVLLHCATAVFLFLALLELTRSRWPSAFVAAVFAIHPLRVESVAWVSERKDVLSGLFFVLILWAYGRYARSSRPTTGRYVMLLVLFALGLMCKPTLVTVPFVLLLLDYWPLRRFAESGAPARTIQYLFVEKIPFFVLSVVSCIATLVAQEKTISTLQQLNFGDRVANAVVSYVAYIGQMIWPTGLSASYPYQEGTLMVGQAILALLILVIISMVSFIWRRKYPFLLVGWLWFLGMLLPMIGLVQVGNQSRADRYTYLSQIGLYFLLTWGAMELFTKWDRGRQLLIALGLLIVIGLMADSHLQASFWRDSETLWNRALVNTSNNYIAETNLGNALAKKEGRLDEAALHCRKALELRPNYPEAHNYLGYVLARQENWADAINSFHAALQSRPDYAEAHSNLAISLSQLGRTDEALAECRTALRLNPDYREVHCNLALILLQLDQRDEALSHLREALRLKPDDPEVKALLSRFE